jgi:hypothetical protein
MPRLLTVLVVFGLMPACTALPEKPVSRSVEAIVQVVQVYPDGISGCFSDGGSFFLSCFHGKIVSGDFKGGTVRFAGARNGKIAGIQNGDLVRLKIDEEKLKKHLHDVQQPELAYVFLYERDCSFEKINDGGTK